MNLKKLWAEGKNSFVVDSPNAVLSAANLKPIIIVLEGIKVDKDKVTFIIRSTSVNSLSMLLQKYSSGDPYLLSQSVITIDGGL